MKILAIGNSFSEDATYYLKKIADSAGTDVTVVNLYIGGCTLQTHAENILADAAAYRYEENGLYTPRMASIRETLQEDTWDIVTVQQQSGNAGVYESYQPHLQTVLDCVKQYAPGARIYFHQTWAYEVGSSHPDFAFYGNDQQTMRRTISDTVARICRENGDLPIIPSGDVIGRVRENPAFNVAQGGRSICRDGFHMDVVYGRYLLGLVWYVTLLNGRVEDVTFVPSPKDLVNGYALEDFQCDQAERQLLKDTVAAYYTESQ